VLVDRVDRLRLMAVTQVARAVVGGALVAGVAMELVDVVLLVVLVFLLYTCEVLYDIAFNSALPSVVDRTRLQWANSRLITAEVVTFQFAGPALGGVLFALSPLLPFAFDGVTFAVSALLLLAVARRVVSKQPRAVTNDQPSIRTEFVEGLRWFWRHSVVRALTLIGMAVNLAAGGFYAVLVLLVRDEIGAGSVGYGLLLAVGAVGSVAAGIAAGRLTGGRMRRATVLALAPATALCFTLIAVATNAVVVALAMIVFSFAVTTGNVVMVSLRQLLTPDAVLGRVMAVHRFFCWGALPVGAALAGLVGQLWGVREAIAACGIVALVVGLGTGVPLLRLPGRAYTPE
jgi:Flp pilus assembly pilin Flp